MIACSAGAVCGFAAAGRPRPGAQALSLALWQELGPDVTQTYFDRTGTEQDNTYFSPTGATAVARLVAREPLRPRVLAPHGVRRLDEEIPPSWITWPEAAA
ncbi:hypothetical protein SUDANB60_01418 [Streptomyces sp. enrichment culture]